VAGLMNSFAAASRLVSPSATSLATWVSCAVSARDVSGRLARAWPPVASSSVRARSAKPLAPMPANASEAASILSRASLPLRRLPSHSP
jgi:hypothetical protein